MNCLLLNKSEKSKTIIELKESVEYLQETLQCELIDIKIINISGIAYDCIYDKADMATNLCIICHHNPEGDLVGLEQAEIDRLLQGK